MGGGSVLITHDNLISKTIITNYYLSVKVFSLYMAQVYYNYAYIYCSLYYINARLDSTRAVEELAGIHPCINE